ncbi:MAG: (2Fe-2S)-binding protein [Deltaproteobacteria bacterium]|nr:(2Fe-2S)-binding protein [Deltaproteobacteria bacterium]MBF0523941.1 (2Fe-2S)-binding protein [Deltaproteobacteria bacterium]
MIRKRYPLELTINGESVSLSVEPQLTLLELIRNHLMLTGTKEGCAEGACGACTVLLDGAPIRSCLTLALSVAGQEVTTVEGLAVAGKLDPIQQAFVDNSAVQCGFCTPGMIMSVKGLRKKHPHPTEEEIREAISGNICRCTGYVKIIDAVKSATEIQPRLSDTFESG